MTIYKNWLRIGSYGQNDTCLLFDNEPLAEFFEDMFDRKFITLKYFLSNEERTIEEIITNVITHRIGGKVDADYGDRYSEYTGYLWTDEDLMIGGHDLDAELRSNFKHIGDWWEGNFIPEKLWLILDITIEVVKK